MSTSGMSPLPASLFDGAGDAGGSGDSSGGDGDGGGSCGCGDATHGDEGGGPGGPGGLGGGGNGGDDGGGGEGAGTSSSVVMAGAIDASCPPRFGWLPNHSLLMVLVEASFSDEAVASAASRDGMRISTETTTLPAVTVIRISVAFANCARKAALRSASGNVSTVPANVSCVLTMAW